jgi:hypothetical protein
MEGRSTGADRGLGGGTQSGGDDGEMLLEAVRRIADQYR